MLKQREKHKNQQMLHVIAAKSALRLSPTASPDLFVYCFFVSFIYQSHPESGSQFHKKSTI